MSDKAGDLVEGEGLEGLTLEDEKAAAGVNTIYTHYIHTHSLMCN